MSLTRSYVNQRALLELLRPLVRRACASNTGANSSGLLSNCTSLGWSGDLISLLVADAPIAATGLEHDLVVVVRNVDHLERSDVNCLNPFAG